MTQLVLVLCYFHSNTLGRFRNVKKFYNIPLLKTRGKLQENADNFPKSNLVLVSSEFRCELFIFHARIFPAQYSWKIREYRNVKSVYDVCSLKKRKKRSENTPQMAGNA